MKTTNRFLKYVFILGVVALGFSRAEVRGEQPAPSLSIEAKLKQGERIYREGVLPSGEPMQAVVKGDITVSGTVFTCVSCHLRSGLGSFEGGVITPPTNGPSLFQPLEFTYKTVKLDSKLYPEPIHRKAYSDETLATALRGGVDPSGRIFNPVMPRYFLQDADMEILVSYLKNLSVQTAPGVSDTLIRFATVVTDDVSAEDENTMMSALNYIVSQKNNSADLYMTNKRSARMAATMLYSSEVMFKKLSLVRWKLTGPPDTWRSQLESYYRSEPVFALLGGISHGDWKPIHDFCEEKHIPSLFPLTDYPIISETDWYTLYLSKGLYQEGEGAARYLNSIFDSITGKQIIQITRNSRPGRALARGFEAAWQEAGHQQPVNITIENGEKLSSASVQKELGKYPGAIIILWDGSESPEAIEILATSVTKPHMIVVSSSYMSKDIWKIREQDREYVFLTYPYRLPQNEVFYKNHINDMSKKAPLKGNAEIVTKRIYATSQVLNLALMDMRGNYFRDNLLDVIGMFKDQDLPLYERLSFGPGQRYASKGCYIVQLGKGAQPELIKRSDWVIH